MTDQLLHSPADVLAQLVVDLSLGGDPTESPLPAWPVYPTKEPDLPDRAVTVYDTMGVVFGTSSGSSVTYYKAGVQVRVRAELPNVSYAKADTIAKTLNKSPLARRATVTLDGTDYCVEVVTMGLVIPLRTDTPVSKRAIHVVSGYVTLTRID